MNKRLIARLDIKNNAVVKGINMEGLRVIGSPSKIAKSYYDSGIDELIYMDVVASLYDRNGLVELIKETAKNIFIPLCVGGGIRTINDVEELLSAGADKIMLNTAAVKRPNFIEEIASRFGSSTVVCAIEVIKYEGDYLVFTDNGREYTGIHVKDWVLEVQRQGVGEIVISSIDCDGLGEGLDFELISDIKSSISVPLIVHGGIGNVQHIADAMNTQGVDAVCVSSLFHYHKDILALNRTKEIEGNQSFASSGRRNQMIDAVNIAEVKGKINPLGYAIR
jgi:imidazole glycerol-phosphate synthase subunit HisF